MVWLERLGIRCKKKEKPLEYLPPGFTSGIDSFTADIGMSESTDVRKCLTNLALDLLRIEDVKGIMLLGFPILTSEDRKIAIKYLAFVKPRGIRISNKYFDESFVAKRKFDESIDFLEGNPLVRQGEIGVVQHLTDQGMEEAAAQARAEWEEDENNANVLSGLIKL